AALPLVSLSFSLLVGCGGSAPPARAAEAAYPPAAGYPMPSRAPAGVESKVQAASKDEEARDEPSFTASTGSDSSTTPAPAQQPPPPPSAPQASPPSAAAVKEKPDPTKEPAQHRDLVIYTARITMAVYQVDQGLTAVEKIARDNGGYLGQKKDREITVRIPRGRFDTTLAAIDRIGDVLHRDIQAEDVTDEHVDLEIRIKNARAMQRRLSDLLGKASVKDALEIEKELHRVTEELERLEGRMKVLKDRIAFSTITVAFEPRGSQIQTARVRLPFPWLGGLNLPSLLSLSEEK
ncbi:MAG: hypothetical protein K0S65_1906, partial [Labilithrix sp.]|nr:hypothetical protein [Labilithrix sp.]